MSELTRAEVFIRFDELMANASGAIGRALSAGREYLASSPMTDLLCRVGRTVEEVPPAPFPDKRWFQLSFGRGVTDAPDDFMVGHGLFYLTEQRRLFLDCTAGHYQMTWGYDHPTLRRLLLEAIDHGIAWDNHSNIPPAPVKRLAAKLVELANPGVDPSLLLADSSKLNTVLLGIATGSVACGAALKIMLLRHQRTGRGQRGPVLVTIDGNYHGTDVLAQRLRGMWAEYFANLDVVMVQPNDGEELEGIFRRHGDRIAGFWAEPIMMNREAIVLQPEYLQLARRLCDDHGALMAVDEIQTGFWFPEVIYCHRCAVRPDLLILGKGMTAGFHPLSALVYRGDLDLLEQYDAISTNGNAALASLIGLGCIAMIEKSAEEIRRVGTYYEEQMRALAAEFPSIIVEARGAGHMSGLKFARVEDALGFHRAAIERGLWVRVHAYHAGHSTILTKFALVLDRQVVDFTISAMRTILASRPWANR